MARNVQIELPEMRSFVAQLTGRVVVCTTVHSEVEPKKPPYETSNLESQDRFSELRKICRSAL